MDGHWARSACVVVTYSAASLALNVPHCLTCHPLPCSTPCPSQSDLIAGKYMKAPPEAALADKAASKARKAARRSASSGNTGGGAQDFRRYTSPSGFAVLVGRNSRQNETLTMDLANPGDVWMHARCVGACVSGLRVGGWVGLGSDQGPCVTAVHHDRRAIPLHCIPLQGCARRPPADAGTIGAAARGGRPAVCRRPGSLVQQGTHRRQSGVSGGTACCAAVASCCGMLHVIGTDLQHLIRLAGPDLLELLGCLLFFLSSCCIHRACAPFPPPSTRPPSLCSVTMCDPKHISKPTGAKPGQVLVRKESVVVGRPDQSAAAASGEAD